MEIFTSVSFHPMQNYRLLVPVQSSQRDPPSIYRMGLAILPYLLPNLSLVSSFDSFQAHVIVLVIIAQSISFVFTIIIIFSFFIINHHHLFLIGNAFPSIVSHAPRLPKIPHQSSPFLCSY
ncbi:hypothetical protein Pst134EB_014287 [Puccinia striiformis f. sp. tritici]|nr:hypothetical protein Pst134EB_014287 [Puccinia striiformis f. sp. tritici]